MKAGRKPQHLLPLLAVSPLFGTATAAMAAEDAVPPEPERGPGFDLGRYEGSVAAAAERDAVGGRDVSPLPSVSPSPESNAVMRTRQRDGLTLAVGVVSAPSYNGSDKNVLIPGAAVSGRINGYAFSSRGTNLAVDLVREARGQKWDVRLGPLASLRSERVSGIHDPQVKALGKLKRAFELGGTAGISKTGVFTGRHDQIGMRVSFLADVSGRHKSWSLSPTVEYGTPLSRKTYVGMQASANIAGKKFGRYYYDVSPAGSAASGLSAYAGAGSKTGLSRYSIGIAGAQSVSGDLRKGWALVAGVQYSKMQGRYARSPIVSEAGKKSQWLFGLGVAVRI